MRTRLLDLLKERSWQWGQFRLSSDIASGYYIDARMTTVSSEGAYLIGETIYEYTKDMDIDAIGGPQVGAVPLTTATVISYHQHGRLMEGFWVREKAKSHGTQKLIEGKLQPGQRVAIVEDVVTKGKSVLKVIEVVQELGCKVVLVLAVVDRLEGAKELFRQHRIENYRAVFTIKDFL